MSKKDSNLRQWIISIGTPLLSFVIAFIYTLADVPIESTGFGIFVLIFGFVLFGYTLWRIYRIGRLLYDRRTFAPRRTINFPIMMIAKKTTTTSTSKGDLHVKNITMFNYIELIVVAFFAFTMIHYGIFLIDNRSYDGVTDALLRSTLSKSNHFHLLEIFFTYTILMALGIGATVYVPIFVAAEITTALTVLTIWIAAGVIGGSIVSVELDRRDKQRDITSS